MSDTLVLYVASPDDERVVAGVAAWLMSGRTTRGDDVVTVDVPGREATVIRGAVPGSEDIAGATELRHVFVWDAHDGIAATLDLAGFLRGRGLRVIVDPDNPRLLAAAAAAHVAAA